MIQEIIVLSDTGIPLFFHDFLENDDEENSNYQLIASYFDQICRFAKYGFKESITTLKMNKSVFYFYTHPTSHYHLILKCDSKIDEKKLKRKSIDLFAKEVFDRFLTKYEAILTNFKGDISNFKSFSKDLKQLAEQRGFLRDWVTRTFQTS